MSLQSYREKYTHKHTRTRTYKHSLKHTQDTGKDIDTHTRIYTHTHIHTYTHVQGSIKSRISAMESDTGCVCLSSYTECICLLPLLFISAALFFCRLRSLSLLLSSTLVLSLSSSLPLLISPFLFLCALSLTCSHFVSLFLVL